MYKQFTISVIVLKEMSADTDVLMIHHKKFDKWMVPGGHIERYENPNEAAIREVYEETGVQIRLFSFLHSALPVTDGTWLFPAEYFYEQLIPESAKEEAHYHLDSTFLAIASNSTLILNEKETNGVKWVPIAEIQSINTFEGTRATILEVHKNLKNKKNVNHDSEEIEIGNCRTW